MTALKITLLIAYIIVVLSLIAWGIGLKVFLNKNSDKKLGEVETQMKKYIYLFSAIWYFILFLFVVKLILEFVDWSQ